MILSFPVAPRATRTALMTASEELSMKLILGQKSLDDWESHIATLKAFGLDEVLAVYQGRHARWQGTN